MEKKNVFASRSLCEIADLSIDERKYLFSQVKILKKAILEQDKKAMDAFRINDKDFGIYEVFLEDSTRTKESFRNASEFQQVKVSELMTGSSSINKGESFADTFHTLCGYHNSIFIIRSKVEGLCRWLMEDCTRYAERNHLPYKPAFVNAGDGKHEHPTQELLDEFTFLEDNGFDYDSIHLALVGDLFHGRTVHSKVEGLKLFKKVRVDLVAPEELAMPEQYVVQMKENGFDVRFFPSIAEYLKEGDISTMWYFTRPQLERMGEQILQKADFLRESITFRPEFMGKLKPGTKFYHPLPRHKEHPTIPTFLDNTPLNAWERQSINGMYVRICLLSLIGGRIGWDYVAPKGPVVSEDEDYIQEVDLKDHQEKPKVFSEGVHPIKNGIVIDHICRGETPGEIRDHMRLISRVLHLDETKGGEWVSSGHKEGDSCSYKGIIFRPDAKELDRKSLKRLAAVAPGCTLNIIKDGKVEKKYRLHMPPRIYNFDDLQCSNDACISNPTQCEGVPAMFYRTEDNMFRCAYCGKTHTFKEIWKSTK
jgi:aspartate carbamoyltransferase